MTRQVQFEDEKQVEINTKDLHPFLQWDLKVIYWIYQHKEVCTINIHHHSSFVFFLTHKLTHSLTRSLCRPFQI